jgi:hypothetical protein
MKTSFKTFAASLICLGFTALATAQVPGYGARIPQKSVAFTDTKVLSFHPFAMITGSLRLSFETKVTDKTSLKVIGGFSLADRSIYYYEVENMWAYYAEVQYRYYIGNPASPAYHVLKGAYAAPFLLNQYMDYDHAIVKMSASGQYIELVPRSSSGTGGGIVIGYQAITGSSLALDVYAGGGIMAASGDYKTLNSSTAFEGFRRGVIPHLGFNLGFSF